MKTRIVGLDIARAFAIIGMIIVNFRIAFGSIGNEKLNCFIDLFQGKAAALFVVLAGVGIAFSTKKIETFQGNFNIVRIRILKRALFLFVVGILYMPIWTADILHFYGIYMLMVCLLLKRKPKDFLVVALFIIFIYPLLMLFFNYDTSWNYKTFYYEDLWSIRGFLRNLFFNGYHPVMPWVAFMLIGVWLGKKDLSDVNLVKKIAKFSFLIFVLTITISKGLIYVLSEDDFLLAKELKQILGVSPMPPLPFYMISGSSFAILIISLCILIPLKYRDSKIVKSLIRTGQLALTFYIAHVIIGMGIIELFSNNELGDFSVEFSLLYAIFFSLLCVIFANFWKRKHKLGPLEWIMRKLTD